MTSYPAPTLAQKYGADQSSLLNRVHVLESAAATYGTPVSVRSWGARGNGVADDTAAIQAAIKAAGSAAAVYFPAGTYLISAPLNLMSGGTYVGAGMATVIKQANGANQARLLQWPSGTNSYCLLADMVIDGNRANNATTTCYGVYAFALQYSVLRNVRVQNVNGDGYRLDGASGGFANTTSTVHLVDCWAYGSANNGLVTTSFAADVHVLGGDYGFSGSSAITLQGGSSSIRGAVLWGTSSGPGLIVGAQSCQIVGCNIEGNSQQGIVVNQFGSYTLISGCKVYDNSTAGSGLYDGIYVNGVSGTNVAGVVIDGCFIYPDVFAGGTTQAHAIRLDTFHQQCSVTGCNVGFAGSQASWSPSNSLIQGQGTSDYVAGNPGFNPMGLLSGPAVAGSGTAVQNSWGVPVTIYVSGGTVSQIAINGSNTNLTSGTFRLGPGQSITLTYTAAPSWTWIGD